MAAPVPAPYYYRQCAGYFRHDNGAGPYFFDGTSTFTLLGAGSGGGGGSPSLDFSQATNSMYLEIL